MLTWGGCCIPQEKAWAARLSQRRAEGREEKGRERGCWKAASIPWHGTGGGGFTGR